MVSMASKEDLVQNFKSALDFLRQYISPLTMAHSHFAQSQAGIRRHNSQTNLTVNLASPGHSDLLFHIDTKENPSSMLWYQLKTCETD